jgi:hypothetical protein
MSDALVNFVIPASFVVDRVKLTPSELVYGYRGGWITDRDVVAIALAAFGTDADLAPAAEELALLLSDDLARVPALVDELSESSAAQSEAGAVWLFLALAWLYEHRSEYPEPLEVVEMLYADFDYPEEIEGLVRFMPQPSGAATGHHAIERRWEEYLSHQAARFRGRSPL